MTYPPKFSTRKVQQISPLKFPPKNSTNLFSNFSYFIMMNSHNFNFVQTGAKKNDLITFVLDVGKMLPGISSPPTV